MNCAEEQMRQRHTNVCDDLSKQQTRVSEYDEMHKQASDELERAIAQRAHIP